MTAKLFTSRWANKELSHLDVVVVKTSLGRPRFAIPYQIGGTSPRSRRFSGC